LRVAAIYDYCQKVIYMWWEVVTRCPHDALGKDCSTLRLHTPDKVIVLHVNSMSSARDIGREIKSLVKLHSPTWVLESLLEG